MSSKTNPKKYLVIVLAFLIGSGSANADFIFGTPTNLGPSVNSSSGEGAPSISADGLSLFFVSLRFGGSGSADIWVTTRETINDDWGTPVNLGPTVNSSAWDGELSISADGLELYFASDRPGGSGGYDLWVTRRATTNDPWGELVNLGPNVNTSFDDTDVCISADGLSLYLESYRGGGHGSNDLWVTKRATKSDPWGEPVNLGPTVNSSASDGAPSISADGRTLFFSDFSSPRPGGYGGTDIWVTTRASVSDPWGEPVNIGPTVNGLARDQGPNISSDGSTLYFFSTRSGGSGDFDLWQMSIEPVVDLNGDGIIDVKDVVTMTQHWGENYPLCDIGPTPLGDGIVDVRDLLVLAEYIKPEVRPLAHWALDESEGIVAQDSAGDNDAYVIGGPVWQPTGGMVDGAIQLDGVDDCVITGPIPNPTEGPFSVFAWVKGGAPGQAVLSQMGGARWLCTDPLEGNLMTELRSASQDGSSLGSETVITDGDWHRIGIVWDGLYRTLYVDGVVVAEDTQDSLEGSENGLYIGTGKAMQSGTYWSGLIDDVRIYNRVVMP